MLIGSSTVVASVCSVLYGTAVKMCALGKQGDLEQTLKKAVKASVWGHGWVWRVISSLQRGWAKSITHTVDSLCFARYHCGPETWPLRAWQYLRDNTYSSDSHCTENFLPRADIVLTQWMFSPQTLVQWLLLWGWQSHYRNTARAASL